MEKVFNDHLLSKEAETYFRICNLHGYANDDILNFLKILYIHKNSLIGKYEKQHKFLEENKYLLENSLGHIEELNILMEESVKVIDKRINSENKILLELIKLNTSSLEDKINSLENKVNLLENQLKPSKKSIVKVCYKYFVNCVDFIYACMLIILLIALYLPQIFLLS